MFDGGSFIRTFYSGRHKENSNNVFGGSMITSSALVLAAKFAEKYIQTLPNYNQKKKEQFYEAKKRYFDEIKKEVIDRDDNRVGNYYDELHLILEAFDKEIFDS